MTHVTVSTINNNNTSIIQILGEYNFDTTRHNGNNKYSNTTIHVE